MWVLIRHLSQPISTLVWNTFSFSFLHRSGQLDVRRFPSGPHKQVCEHGPGPVHGQRGLGPYYHQHQEERRLLPVLPRALPWRHIHHLLEEEVALLHPQCGRAVSAAVRAVVAGWVEVVGDGVAALHGLQAQRRATVCSQKFHCWLSRWHLWQKTMAQRWAMQAQRCATVCC